MSAFHARFVVVRMFLQSRRRTQSTTSTLVSRSGAIRKMMTTAIPRGISSNMLEGICLSRAPLAAQLDRNGQGAC